MRLAWCTDIHLNFCDFAKRVSFYNSINESKPEAIVITGDIAEGYTFDTLLKEMKEHTFNVPILFVLGNHDYYQSSFIDSQLAAAQLKHEGIHFMNSGNYFIDNNSTCIVGAGGWADARLGNYKTSRVRLNDWYYIEDFKGCKSIIQIHKRMKQLAKIEVDSLESRIRHGACLGTKNILVLTHVPPYEEAAMHNGRRTETDVLPYYSSKYMGDMLKRMANLYQNKNFVILAGHTHSKGYAVIKKNLRCLVGEADYYHPKVQEIIDTETLFLE